MADAVITTTVTDTSQLLSDGACYSPRLFVGCGSHSLQMLHFQVLP
ncbi:hypothetical protein CMEL01_15589 [Colletotrichum melonis]|uniref:Uncharacterized protein n=1 Tax=Colletotrichum melonis TaxID=1209925 RepID=A0AAI9UJJ8_9PEZI|nr:hypothetical protein CMEL01_15589 [Colletotrichum melonis]